MGIKLFSPKAPAPSKDFYQLQLTTKEVIIRSWRISLRNEFRDARPSVNKESHQDFLDSPTIQAQVGIIFGENILQYVVKACQGHFDFLERLPEPLILRILDFLDLEDIARLSQVSHRFQTICNSDKFWEHIVETSCDRITPEMRSLAQDVGWKTLFFTNKLQLQLQLRRRKNKQDQEMSRY
ncbi:F-box only protein 36 [Bombina bombina]|uniref:F-box only protein 36 n=1 Tax=Bombina bombina TaxID=8345 RepID=UPI00235AEF8D|nr:F-box only protein 36 [Bombina bombina]